MTVIATGFGGGRAAAQRVEPATAPVGDELVGVAGRRASIRVRATRRPRSTSRASSATDARSRPRTAARGEPTRLVRRSAGSGASDLGGASSGIGRARERSPAPNAAPRTPRRPRRAHGAVRRLGDARAVRGRDPRAPRGPGATAGVFDVSHMGQLARRGPDARTSSSRRCSRTTSTGSATARPSTRCSRTSAAGSSTT